MSKLIVAGFGGFLAGVGVGYFAAMKHFELKYARISNEEIASVKEVYDAKIEKMMKYYPDKIVKDHNKEKMAKKKSENADGRTKQNEDLTRSPIQMNSYERAKQNYNLIRQSAPAQDLEDEDCDDDEYTDAAGMTEEESAAMSDLVEGDPYLIESDEYTEENPGFDKISLYYYRIDDVICSEDGEDIITEVEETIGYDALCKLDMQTTVWVRNERLHLEYEIIAVNGAYSDEFEKASSPRERYNKSKRRDDNEE